MRVTQRYRIKVVEIIRAPVDACGVEIVAEPPARFISPMGSVLREQFGCSVACHLTRSCRSRKIHRN